MSFAVSQLEATRRHILEDRERAFKDLEDAKHRVEVITSNILLLDKSLDELDDAIELLRFRQNES